MKNLTLLFAITALLTSAFAQAAEHSFAQDTSLASETVGDLEPIEVVSPTLTAQARLKVAALFAKTYSYFPEGDTVKKVIVVMFVIAIMVVPVASLFALPFAQAKPLSYYKRSLEEKCKEKGGKFVAKDSYSVPAEHLRKIQILDLNQANFGTCFAFSGYTLAQMHEWKHGGPDLALPHALASGSGEKFVVDGGLTREFLLELSSHEIVDGESYPFDYNRTYTNLHRLNPERRADTSAAITASMRDSFVPTAQIETYLDDVESGNVATRSGKYQFDILHNIPGLKRVSLHPYQVRFRESESEDQIIGLVKNHFKMNQTNTPLSLAFCPDAEGKSLEDADATCPGGNHQVTIVGVRKACCNNECVPEWYIENSYGQESNQKGWHQAIPLARSSAQFKRGIIDLTDCPNGSYCSWIEGKYPVHYLVRASDANRLADFFAKAAHADALNVVNAYDQTGSTPLIQATLSASKEIMLVLLSNGANPSIADKSGTLTPLSIALLNANVEAAELLIENGAAYFLFDQDKEKAKVALGTDASWLGQVPTLQYESLPSKYEECSFTDFACHAKNAARKKAMKTVRKRIAPLAYPQGWLPPGGFQKECHICEVFGDDMLGCVLCEQEIGVPSRETEIHVLGSFKECEHPIAFYRGKFLCQDRHNPLELPENSGARAEWMARGTENTDSASSTE